jgi:hypothetical protein
MVCITEKSKGTLWVTMELYWQCQNFFQQSKQGKGEARISENRVSWGVF